jgi:HemY protein
MRRTLFFLIQLALLVAAAVFLADRPGEVRVDWHGWRIETSAALVALVLVAIAWVLSIVFALWRRLKRAPREMAVARRERRREAGYEALGRGLAAVAAGDAVEARRLARKASGLLDEPPLTRLLSAQAAQLSGDEAEARRQFEAMRADPATEFLGLRGLLSKALRDGDRKAALVLAERALVLQPTAPWLLVQTFELQSEAGHARAALTTLAEAAGRGAIEKDRARRARAVLLTAVAADTQGATENTGEAKHLLTEAVDLAPGFTPAAVALSRVLAASGGERKAIKLLERAWATNPHPDLAQAWLALKGEAAPLDRLRWLQRLAAAGSPGRDSNLVLAEASLDAGLWGEARRLLQDLIADPSPKVARLMARIDLEERNDSEAARAWLERAQTAASADPDPIWVCRACGTQAADWSANCGHCGSFDALEWKPPPRIQRIQRAPMPAIAHQPDPVPESPSAPAATG